MKKMFLIFVVFALLLPFGGCDEVQEGNTGATGEPFSTIPSESPPETTSGIEIPVPTASPSPSASIDDVDAAQLFRSFLSDNYDKLMELSFKYLVGIGFIDLNLDGVREMILFDAGASASMGVEIFEVFGGAVRCVTANIAGLAEAFSGGTSQILINANYFDDFRLVENNSTGGRFFIVESKNGNIEESYSEYISFGSGDDGALTLGSLCYKRETYDTETGEITGQSFRLGKIVVDETAYAAAIETFLNENTDLELECKGAFVWENSEYTENNKNFMELVDRALDLYTQNRVQ